MKKLCCIVAFMFAVFSFASVTTASEIMSQSNFDELLKEVEAGDPEAQYILGGMCYVGEGVKQDYEQAAYWFKKAAEQGHVKAQYFLGSMYDEGKELKQDYEQAEYWYKKAAEQGFAEAQFRLGLMYDLGKGVKQDNEKAKYWYGKAVENGHEGAKVPLAVLEFAEQEKNTTSRTAETPVYEEHDYNKLTEAEYMQMMKNPEFAEADKAFINAWKNAEKSLDTNAFNVLKQGHNKWISNGWHEWANILAEEEGEYGFSKTKAYAVAMQARAKYVSLWTSGYCAANVTGDKVNVRSKPNTKGKVLFQVSRYLYGGYDNERERLIVDINYITDNKGDKWHLVHYRYNYTPDSDAPQLYEKANGYINSRFVSLEYLSERDYDLIVPPTAFESF